MPGQNRIDFQVGFKADTSGIEKAKQALAGISNIKINSFSGTQEELNDIIGTANTVQKVLTQAFNVKLDSINTDKFNQGLKNAGLSIQDIRAKLNSVGPQGEVAFNQLATSVLTSNLHLKETNNIINNMGTTMMNTVKWGITSSIMNTFTSSVQQAFQYVKSLDSALNDIRIVTGNSSEQMSNFAEQANRAASELGRSTMDYTKAALTFYQQGLDEESVQARAETVLKAQNITGAGSEMADYLTAVWNGYKVANEEAELYVDKLAAVADSSASNMSQLAIAMSKVASTANTMGVDVDQLNAQIATIVATTRQAPQSVGNALKTIYTRINDISTGAEGAEISLGTYSSRLAQMGINVLDSNNELRDTGEVIEEIGSKWETFSREQQVSIARTMAGQRQINNMTALFDNWDKYINLVSVSLDSQGTTMEKNSIYMDSLAAHMQQLGTAGERVKSALIDADSFKDLIDVATELTKAFANFIEGIGGGGNALLAFGSIATSVFSKVIAKEISNFVTGITNAKQNLKILAADVELTREIGKEDVDTLATFTKKKEEIQQYYSLLSQGEINNYNAVLKTIGLKEIELDQTNQLINGAASLNKVMQEQGGFRFDGELRDLQQLNGLLDQARDRFMNMDVGTEQASQNLRAWVESIKNTLGEAWSSQQGSSFIDSLLEKQKLTKDQAEKLRQAFLKIIETIKTNIGNTNSIDQLREKAKTLNSQIEALAKGLDEYLNKIKQMSNIQVFTKAVAGIGQVASGLNSLRNISNIIANENLSSGEKILQVLSAFSMGFGQIVAGVKNLQPVAAKTFAILFEGITGVNFQTLASAASTTTWTAALNAAGLSAGKLMLAFGPIAAIAVGIGLLVNHFIKLAEEQKKAAKALEEFNKREQQFNSKDKDYNTKIKNLKDVQAEYEELAKKAGADNYDNTINNLTQAERARYNEIKQLFVSYNNNVKAGYNDQNELILKKNSSIAQTIELLQKQRQKQFDLTYGQEGFQNYKTGRANQIKQAREDLADARSQIGSSYPVQDRIATSTWLTNQINTIYPGFSEGKGPNSQNFNELLKTINDADSSYDEVQTAYNNFVEKIKKDAEKPEHHQAAAAIVNSGEGFWDLFTEYFKGNGEDIKGLLATLEQESFSLKDLEDKLAEVEQFTDADIARVSQYLKSEQLADEWKTISQHTGRQTAFSLYQNFVKKAIEDLENPQQGGESITLDNTAFEDYINKVAEQAKTHLQETIANLQIIPDQDLITKLREDFQKQVGEIKKEDLSPEEYHRKVGQIITSIINDNKELKKYYQTEEDSSVLSDVLNSIFGGTGEVESVTRNAENKIQTEYITPLEDSIKSGLGNINGLTAELVDSIFKSLTGAGYNNKDLSLINTVIQELDDLSEYDGDIEKIIQHILELKDALEKDIDNSIIQQTFNLLNQVANGENLSDEQWEQINSGLNKVKQKYPELISAAQLLKEQWLRGTDAYSQALDEVREKQLNLIAADRYEGKIDNETASQRSLNWVTDLDSLEQARSKGALSETGETQALVKIGSGYDNLTEEVTAATNAYAAYKQALASGNEYIIRHTANTLEAANAALEEKIAFNEQAEALGFTAEEVDSVINKLQTLYPQTYNTAEAARKGALQYLNFNKELEDFQSLSSEAANKSQLGKNIADLFNFEDLPIDPDAFAWAVQQWIDNEATDQQIKTLLTAKGEELQQALIAMLQALGLTEGNTQALTEQIKQFLVKSLTDAKEEATTELSNFDVTNLTASISYGGQTLNDSETEQLIQGLERLKQEYPEIAEQVQFLTNTWASQSDAYKRIVSDVSAYVRQQEAEKLAELRRLREEGSEQEKARAQEEIEAIESSYIKGLTSAGQALDLFEAGILQFGTKIPGELALTAQSLSQLDDLLAYGAITGEEFALALKEVSHNEIAQYDLDVDEYENYVSLLRATNEAYAENEYLARKVAQAELRISKGTKTLQKNFEKWTESLQDYINSGGDILNLAQDWGDLSQAIENTFALEPGTLDLLGPDFVAQNWDKFQNVAQGIEGSWEEVQALLEQQLIVKAYGVTDFSELDQNVQDAYLKIQELDGLDFTIVAGMDGTDQIFNAFQTIADGANWTSAEAQKAFSQMGYDIQVEEKPDVVHEGSEETQYYVPPTYKMESLPFNIPPFGFPVTLSWPVEDVAGHYESAGAGKKESYQPGTYAIKSITPNGKGSGGNISRRSVSPKGGGNRGGGGGGGGGGKKGSTPKPAKQAKTIDLTNLTKGQKPLQADKDPYHEINLDLKRQGKLLDDIAEKEKKTITRDRIDILNEQIDALEEENRLLDKKKNIANGELNTQRNQLEADFGKDFVQYDQEGYVANFDEISAKSAKIHNDNLKKIQADLKKVEKEYNNWIKNVYNKAASEEQQEKLYKAEKERRDEALKDAQDDAKQKQKDEADYHKQRMANLKEYEETLKLQEEIAKQKAENQEKQYQQRIARSKVKVQLGLDTGDAERDWLEFEKKFIKKIKTDDIIGNAKYTIGEINSYIDSEQIKRTKARIDDIRKSIEKMEGGGLDKKIYGRNLAQAKEDLQTYMKQLRDDLMKIQDLQQQMRDYYLDSIDQAKDKFADHVDQYNRINDLIEHNIQLTELLYGDKAYNTLGKYYDMQYDNNIKTISMLKQQADYWKQLMNGEQQNSEAWKRFKQNWEQATDNINSMLEETIDLLSTRFENALNKAIENTNNKLTNGLGVDYLDQQWDAINNYDDTFLDTVNSKFGIEEVERLYQNASNELMGNPKQQQRINNLMNEQLKILREKDKLTQYDIDRAKALLEVEQARMALEDARNAKTKMRLRRDRQGNYTYQYVADEEKLEDLQSALAQAQSNLYNQDKEHYKQNLDQLYQTYKNYIEQMKELTEAYNATQDEQERARIQRRIDLLKSTTAQLMEGLTEDNKYAMQYLTQSTFDSLEIDPSVYTAAEQLELLTQNVPQVNSEIQSLANNIVGEGGILNATADMINEFTKATKEYDLAVKEVLEGGGTSLDTIANVVDESNKALDSNITTAQELLEVNEKLIKSCQDQVAQMQALLKVLDQYMKKMMNTSSLVGSLVEGQNLLQQLNGGIISNISPNAQTVVKEKNSSAAFSGNSKQDTRTVKQKIQNVLQDYQDFLNSMSGVSFNTGGFTGVWNDVDGRMAILHEKELVLNQEDTANILAAVRSVREMTSLLNMQSEFNDLQTNMSAVMSTAARSGLLDQNVHIEANFPNVTQHTEIEQAFNNLVNMASMHASKPRSAL